MVQRVLITGGAGFIGSALARALVGAGHAVTIVDSLSPQVHGDVPSYQPLPGIQFVRADVRSLVNRPELLDPQDVIYHLAAETGTGQSMYRISHYVDVNEMGTANLLEGLACCSRRRRRVVLASSRSIYGEGAYADPAIPGAILQPDSRTSEQLAKGLWDFEGREGRPLVPLATPENLPAKPGSIYAATKMSQELLLRSAAAALDLSVTILRLQNVYGEGQSLRNPYTGIISIFFNRARQGLPINVFEDGEESRDFVHVDDVVVALMLALDADAGPGRVLNVGSGQPTSVLTIARTLCGLAGLNVPIVVSGDYRVGDIRHGFADVSAIRDAFGFSPRIGIEQGLRRFVAWAAKERAFEDLSDRAATELRARGLTK
ncbi:NAD-dependent epimerase/dehydratase family protein [Rhodopseudomonas palustris]|nr:NAD-dependent epimerase/dehydratase family protein [Rhodopseudomonas palustris]